MPTVLVVDDRSEVRALVAEPLEAAGLRVCLAADGLEGWRCFRDARPDLVITDLHMPRCDGLELLRRVRSVSAVPVVLLTARADVATAVAGLQGGANEYLLFPEQLDRLVARARELVAGCGRHADAVRAAELFPGRSVASWRVRERLHALAPLRVPVLVRGEPGSGRDTLVHALHDLAGSGAALVVLRPQAPSAGDPRSARLDAPVYLDEVGRHPREAGRRWAERLAAADAGSRGGFRLYASTSQDLAALARSGAFDPALARRLARFSIELPPLRARKADLPQMVRALTPRVAAALGHPGVRMRPSAVARLRAHAWPGNVAELVAVLERAVAFARDGAVAGRGIGEVLAESVETLRVLRERRGHSERDRLVGLLRECAGNLAEVGRRLGLSRGAVYYRLRKHGLVHPRASPRRPGSSADRG